MKVQTILESLESCERMYSNGKFGQLWKGYVVKESLARLGGSKTLNGWKGWEDMESL